MTLATIEKNSSVFTDENFKDEDILSLGNKAINRINIECKTKFPAFKGLGEDYKAIPVDWLMSLVSPYLSYGIKMNDTSLSEADRYLEEFNSALNAFRGMLGTLVDTYLEGEAEGDEDKIAGGVSPEFIETEGFGGVYGIDTSGAINIGWFGNDGNGGSF